MAWGTFLAVKGTYYRPGAEKFNWFYITATAFSLQSTGSFCLDSTERCCRLQGKRGTYTWVLVTDTGSVHPHLPWPP